MKSNVIVNTRLGPMRRPGRDILFRAVGFSTSQIARRDLARYYEVLEASTQGLKGRFSEKELEILARALKSLAKKKFSKPVYSTYAVVEEIVRYKDSCDMVGIENYESFLQRVDELDLVARCALVDAIERYLVLPSKRRGEEGWKEIGLL